MVSPAGQRSPATLADLLAIPPEERFHESINGELVRKATPTFEHGDAQSAAANGDARARTEPFEAVELPLRTLFGEEKDKEREDEPALRW